LKGQHPLMAEIWSPEKSIWVGQYAPLDLCCLWTKVFITCFRPTWNGLWLNKFFLGFSICRSVPKIFAIKVESRQKSRRNLDVFWPSQNFWGESYNSCTHIITPASQHVVWKSFLWILFPLAPKL